MPSHLLRAAGGGVAAAALVCSLALAPSSAFARVVPTPVTHSAEGAALALTPLGSFDTGIFDASAAEIVASHGDRLFVVNAKQGSVSVIDASDPASMRELFTVSSEGVANSVAVRADGLGVIAIEAPVKTDAGHLVFFDATADSARILGTVEVGALPDMVALSSDGTRAVVANEGEPADDFSFDPEGTVSVIDLPATLQAPSQSAVRTANFHAFEGENLPEGVRVFGPTPTAGNPVSRNLEPEYVAIDGNTAYVALQEANAIATVDLASATVTALLPLGAKNYGTEGNGIDPSDKDDAFDIRTIDGLFGFYQPDGLASYQAAGSTYLVTANEGDAREWGDYVEPVRVKKLASDGLGPICEDSPLAERTADADLGRLNVTRENGFDEARGCYTELYAFGGRSFSIWSTDGTQVFDSGDDFERITAAAVPDYVNTTHTETAVDGRSDDKGPEPENLAIGQVGDRTYAFIGLERIGGVMVYDITTPTDASFVIYVNNRDFSVSDPSADLAAAGDLGAEGVSFLSAASSPTGAPALAVANEVSGTTTLFAIEDLNAPDTTTVQVLTLNDFHGRIEANLGSGEAGAAVIGGAVDALSAENPNTLFVSAGDNIGASTFTSFIDNDSPTIDALVAAGLDVSAVGNHEFDKGTRDLLDRVLPRFGGADFGLGANVYDVATGEPVLKEYTVRTIDGVRVAFIGTVTAETAAMVPPALTNTIRFGDQREAADRVASEITEADAADVIVLLAHDGNATASCEALNSATTDFGTLAREASADIDAIVSAHTHQSYACEIEGPGGERPVIQAHQYGTTLGKLDITVNTETDELVSITPSLIPLVVDGAAAYPAKAEVADIVAAAAEHANAAGAERVGAISADVLRGGTAGSDRGVESTLGNLVADQHLWATSNETYGGTPAQIAFINPGGLRADLLYNADGTVTYRDAANVQPFANTLITMTLTGAQLREVLEQQWQPDGASRPKLHLGISDGFTYTYLPDAARGEHITSMQYKGTEITPEQTFTVTANAFLAGGGDNFTTFAAGTNRVDTGQVDLAASVAYFDAHDVVAPAPLGRAIVDEGTVEGPWATVSVGSTSVARGGTLPVTITGLDAGRQVTAAIHSDPLEITGIPAADADGNVSFTATIPADFPLGEHTLVVSAEGETPIEVALTVTAAAVTETPTPTAQPGEALAVTGTQLPWALAFGAVTIIALGLVLAMRRRAQR